MDFRPNQARMVFYAAFIGFFLSMALSMYYFEGGDMIIIGAYLGVALIFLAIAGAFTSGTQWKWEVAFTFMLLQLVLVAAAAYMDAISDLAALVFIVLLLPMLFMGYSDEVKYWFELESL
ncbi:MAG: hypothetical protein AB7E27_02005 [Candidatus Methanomethylophilaceae archaeon]